MIKDAAKLKTKVAIIGAGPAGLMLSNLLHVAGIESVILERRPRDYIITRNRAGNLDSVVMQVAKTIGANERMEKEGLVHDGFRIAFGESNNLINTKPLTDGKQFVIYGQSELIKDLLHVREKTNGNIQFGAQVHDIQDYWHGKPKLIFEQDGQQKELQADFVAGCDGFHGVARKVIPADKLQVFEKVLPFCWLGLLADAPPVQEEIMYTNSERGFALCSMRSMTRCKNYIQADADDKVENWTDDRFYDELKRRLPSNLGDKINRGKRIEMTMTRLRSLVTEPMRFGNLFLAGDAAHIAPPTGAKGCSLASSDAWYLSRAFIAYYSQGRTDLMDKYSEYALRRVWKTMRFSWWATSLLHKFPGDDLHRKLQVAELEYVFSSKAALTTVAENFVGLPLEKFE